jgi:hypothetical protein
VFALGLLLAKSDARLVGAGAFHGYPREASARSFLAPAKKPSPPLYSEGLVSEGLPLWETLEFSLIPTMRVWAAWRNSILRSSLAG